MNVAKTKPNKAAFMKATNPAEAAKVLGHTDGGKKFRSRLRAAGISVSKGGAFNAKAKTLMWNLFVEGKQVVKSTKAKSGGNSKQRRTARRKATPKKEEAQATAE